MCHKFAVDVIPRRYVYEFKTAACEERSYIFVFKFHLSKAEHKGRIYQNGAEYTVVAVGRSIKMIDAVVDKYNIPFLDNKIIFIAGNV